MGSLAVVGTLGAPELLIILVLVLLVFGGAKLPKLARSLGQAQREFKTGLSDSDDEGGEGRSQGERAGRSRQRGGNSAKNGSA